MTATRPHPLRKDAQRNREAILNAARELFAASSEVPMYEIAKRAGVGQATLYRNFPDHRAIADALFAEQVDRLEELAAQHTGDPDAFFVLLRSVAEAQARFHGLSRCLRDQPGAPPATGALKSRFAELIKRPLRDAKAAGTLRQDVTVDDLFLLVAMIEGALNKAADSTGHVAAAMRALALVLDGLTTRPQR